MGNVIITSATPPSDMCGMPASEWLARVALLSGQFNRAGTGINFGPEVPLAVNEDKPWFRTNPDGTPDRIYTHIVGLWVARFFVDPPFTFWYTGAGDDASIAAIHGGEVGAVGDFTGPFWQKVAGFEGRSPIVPGTLASGLVIGVGDDAGSESTMLTAAMSVQHKHEIEAFTAAKTAGGDGGAVLNEADAANPFGANTEDWPIRDETITPQTAVPVLHPVRGIWLLERTSRIYHRFV